MLNQKKQNSLKRTKPHMIAKARVLLQGTSIRMQIFVSMCVISVITTVILGSCIFMFSKEKIEENYQNSHEYNLQVSSSNIEIQLSSIVEEIRTILVNAYFMDIMENDHSESGYFSAINKLSLENMMSGIMNHNQMIQSMLVINLDGNWTFVTKNTTQKSKVDHYYKDDNLLAESWVTFADQAEGKEVFVGYNVLFDENDDEVFSIVKKLIDYNTRETMGYMVLNVKKKLLDKAFSMEIDSYNTNRYMILDRKFANNTANKEIVYFNGNTESRDEILNAFNHYEETLQPDLALKYLFSSYNNEITGWDIVNVIERQELADESNYIRWVTIIMILIIAILSVIVATSLANTISKPLYMLEKTIDQVGDGDYSLNLDFDNSEIGKVGQRFQNMTHNNLELRDKLLNSEIKEKEAELLLLQSQINPHFLYNSLDALYFMAVIDDADDIAEMVKSLSDTFKLSLNKGDKLIYIADELDKIKAYMKIYNFRYHDRFTLVIDVDEKIMKEKILTFILQPVVENAVFHGLEGKIGKGRIVVKGYQKDDMLYFLISDDGIGIDDMAKLEEGYGVKNIRARIALYYGEQYTVEFDSELGRGTTAKYVLPKIHS